MSWLSIAHGRVVTVVKGACRPKSPFLGQYDLFYTCELLYYAKERNGLHIAKECSPTRLREAFRGNWRGSAVASYLCDLVHRIVHGGEHEAALFDLLSGSLDFVSENIPRPQFIFWFEVRLAGNMGFAPRLSECSVCDRALPDSLSRIPFSAAKGGVVCPHCADKKAIPTTAVSPDMIAMLRRWQETASPRLAHNTVCTTNQLASFHELLGTFLCYHLDMETIPASRRIALRMATTRQ